MNATSEWISRVIRIALTPEPLPRAVVLDQPLVGDERARASVW